MEYTSLTKRKGSPDLEAYCESCRADSFWAENDDDQVATWYCYECGTVVDETYFLEYDARSVER